MIEMCHSVCWRYSIQRYICGLVVWIMDVQKANRCGLSVLFICNIKNCFHSRSTIMKLSKSLLALGVVAASAGANAATVTISGDLDVCSGLCTALTTAGNYVVQIVTTDDTTGVLSVGNYIDPGYYAPDSVVDGAPEYRQPGGPDLAGNGVYYTGPDGNNNDGVVTSDLYISDNDALIPPVPAGVTKHYVNVEPGDVIASTLIMNATNDAITGGSMTTIQLLNNAGDPNGGVPIQMFYDLDAMTFTLSAYGGEVGSGTITSVDVVSAVPVPAAAWLFGSALVGLAGVARKRF